MTATTHNTKVPRLHRQTLIEMNVSVFTARRDAAHARAVEILREEVVAGGHEERVRLYTLCRGLLDEAIQATQRSQLQANSPLLRYLKLLADTVGVNLSLLRHEITLASEADELSTLVGGQVPVSIDLASESLSLGESHLLHCVLNLLQFGEPLLQMDSAARRNTFGEDDRRRYELARTEYADFYRTRFTPPAE